MLCKNKRVLWQSRGLPTSGPEFVQNGHLNQGHQALQTANFLKTKTPWALAYPKSLEIRALGAWNWSISSPSMHKSLEFTAWSTACGALACTKLLEIVALRCSAWALACTVNYSISAPSMHKSLEITAAWAWHTHWIYCILSLCIHSPKLIGKHRVISRISLTCRARFLVGVPQRWESLRCKSKSWARNFKFWAWDVHQPCYGLKPQETQHKMDSHSRCPLFLRPRPNPAGREKPIRVEPSASPKNLSRLFFRNNLTRLKITSEVKINLERLFLALS